MSAAVFDRLLDDVRGLLGYRVRSSAPAAAQALEQSSNERDWDAWMHAADFHELLPLLSIAPPVHAPAYVKAELHSHATAVARYNLLVLAETRNLMLALERAHAQPLLFKGPVLAVDAFGALQTRAFVDADILIAASAFNDAAVALRDAGFSPVYDLGPNARALYIDVYRQMPFRSADGHTVVEIHTALMPSYLPMGKPDHAFNDRARTINIAGIDLRTLSLEDHVVLCCMHGTKECWPHLRAVADVAGLLSRHPGIDWKHVHAVASHVRATGALFLGLTLAHWLTGDEPDRHPLRMEPTRRGVVQHVAERVMKRLRNMENRPVPADEFRIVWPVLDTTRDRARFAAHHLAGHSMADWKNWPGGDRLLGLTRVSRPLRLAGKYAKAAARNLYSGVKN